MKENHLGRSQAQHVINFATRQENEALNFCEVGGVVPNKEYTHGTQVIALLMNNATGKLKL